MICKCCKQDYTETAGNCPVCGMPPAPEVFLNPEQHKKWMEEVFLPYQQAYQQKQRRELLMKYRGSASLFAAAAIDYYAWIDSNGGLHLEEMYLRGIGNAQKWKQIQCVSLGTGHLAALDETGQVFATGKNEMGQCTVKEWTDIIRVAAAGDTTAAVTKEGVLVSCGAETGRLKQLSDKLKDELEIEELILSRNQILLLTKYRKKQGKRVICEYYRDVFQEENGWAADVAEDAQITAGDIGCFLLQNHRAEAVNAGSQSVEMAQKLQSLGAPDGIAAGRACLYGFTADGKIFGVEEEGNTFSYQLRFPAEESSLLNLLEIDQRKVIAAVDAGGAFQLYTADLTGDAVPELVPLS